MGADLYNSRISLEDKYVKLREDFFSLLNKYICSNDPDEKPELSRKCSEIVEELQNLTWVTGIDDVIYLRKLIDGVFIKEINLFEYETKNPMKQSLEWEYLSIMRELIYEYFKTVKAGPYFKDKIVGDIVSFIRSNNHLIKRLEKLQKYDEHDETISKKIKLLKILFKPLFKYLKESPALLLERYERTYE